MNSNSSTSAPLLTSYLRLETAQCIAQSIPTITASIPQTNLPNSTPLGSSLPLHPASTLSPVNPLTYSSAAYLTQQVEIRMRDLIRTGLSFMRHSSRAYLTTDDINLALRHKNAQPILGYDGSIAPSSALSGGTAAGASAEQQLFTHPTSSSTESDIFLLNDPLIPLDEFLSTSLPPVPHDASFSVHWLAVDGVQPKGMENPSANVGLAGRATAGAADGDVTNATSDSKTPVTRPPIKHVLSKEQQLYYDYVTSALRGTDSTLKTAVFKSLSEDDGLYQLLPYFTSFIALEVSRNLHNLSFLKSLMRMTACILHSRYLHVDPYLHQLIPSVLTCIVGKQLCLEPFEDHWSLRDYAIDILTSLLNKYSYAYPTLQARITATLTKAWMDTTKSLNTHYGCVSAMKKLGPQTVKKLIIPYIKQYVEQLHPALNSPNEATKMEASFVYHALLNAAADYVKWEMQQSWNPMEVAERVSMAANAAGVVPSPTAAAGAGSTAATAMDTSSSSEPRVKLESDAATSKKRRRGANDAAATASTLSSSPSSTFTTSLISPSSLLPDREVLNGIDMLLDLFGEGLHAQVSSAVKELEARFAATAAANAGQQTAGTVPAKSGGNKIVISRNNFSAATTFI